MTPRMIARYPDSLYNDTVTRARTEGDGTLTTKLVDDVIADMKSASKDKAGAGDVALAADAFISGVESGDLKLENPNDLKKFEKIGAEQAQVWKDDHRGRGTVGQLWDRFVADADQDGKKNAKDDKPLGRW